MLVDARDPAIANPTKYIGQFYSEEEARVFEETRGWQMKKDANRGWRRVVPSPIPKSVVPSDILKSLVEQGVVVIAGGGGGIPVYIDEKGNYEGIDAVIDKDYASAVIGRDIGAGILCILTSVDKVALNFGQPDQKELDLVRLSEIKQYSDQGQFPAGSMGPKIKAAVEFLESGGELVTITSFENAFKAISGEAGTRIIPD